MLLMKNFDCLISCLAAVCSFVVLILAQVNSLNSLLKKFNCYFNSFVSVLSKVLVDLLARIDI